MMKDKASLRKEAVLYRDGLLNREEISREICREILDFIHGLRSAEGSVSLDEILSEDGPVFMDVPFPVFCFYPIGSEVDLRPAYTELLKEGYPLFFPVTREEITFYQVEDMRDFIPGAFYVPEPVSRKEFYFGDDKSFLGLVLTPGLLFSPEGGRMGYGKGFYDRFFSKRPEQFLKIGVGFSGQLRDEVPMESHDVLLDGYCSEKGVSLWAKH